MKLYYKPGACSLASHIALREIGAEFEIEAVDTKAGRTASGQDYHVINPKGYVPALQLRDGEILTEGAAVLLFLADGHPASELAPPVGSLSRGRLHEKLIWIAAECHKAFGPLFRDGSTDAQQDAARLAVAAKFDLIEAELSDEREWLVDGRFSVADAYLFVVVNWANFTGIDLSRWPNLNAFVTRVSERPAVKEAMRAEGLLS